MFRLVILLISIFLINYSMAAEVIKLKVSEDAVVQFKETQKVAVGPNNNDFSYTDTLLSDSPVMHIMHGKRRET